MADELATPDLALFKIHLESAEFCYGEDSEWWGHQEVPVADSWPYFQVWIAAPENVVKGGVLWLRLELSNYPKIAPAGLIWDSKTNQVLTQDRGPDCRAGKNIGSVFKNNTRIYAPWDRGGLTPHPEWTTTHKHTCWTPGSTIADYLRHTHRLIWTRLP